MEPRWNLFGLSAQAKVLLIEKLSSSASVRSPRAARRSDPEDDDAIRLDVSKLEGFREVRMIREAADFLGISDPFFRVHEGIAGAETVIEGRSFVNFASSNYIGLNRHADVVSTTMSAIHRYDTPVSATRPVSGELPVHLDL